MLAVVILPEFKHIMIKNYVFFYLILIKYNKIFWIKFSKRILLAVVILFSIEKVQKVLFLGENDKGYYDSLIIAIRFP